MCCSKALVQELQQSSHSYFPCSAMKQTVRRAVLRFEGQIARMTNRPRRTGNMKKYEETHNRVGVACEGTIKPSERARSREGGRRDYGQATPVAGRRTKGTNKHEHG